MSKSRMLAVAGVWLVLILILGVTWKFLFAPKIKQDQETKQAEEKNKVITSTSSSARYKHQATITADNFSGYAVLRSEAFHNDCSARGIKIVNRDDQADYTKRIKDLQSGETDFAVFTLGSLIKASALIGDLPGVALLIIDASFGADAAVASKNFPDLDALNDPATKVVLTPDSPSEEFFRVVQQTFHLNRISANQFIHVNGMPELLQKFKASKPNDKMIFVGWEPTISQMVQGGLYNRLIDTSKVTGQVVDVLVVSRDFLVKNEDVVQDVVEAYFRANYTIQSNIKDAILTDAKMTSSKLTVEDVGSVVKGIRWRNTQENYAHFGITSRPGYMLIDDMISNSTTSLLRAKAIDKDPTGGSPNLLYYDKVVRSLFDNNFHPGVSSEEVQQEVSLKPLTEEQWGSLVPVGTLQVAPLVFARGRSNLIGSSEGILADLASKLKSWPQYYLLVKGHTKGSNTPENLALQKARADAAVTWLTEHGVPVHRVKAEASESNGSTTVKFVLGQLPY